MSVRKLFGNKKQIDSKVDVNIHENGDNVIIINEKVDTTQQTSDGTENTNNVCNVLKTRNSRLIEGVIDEQKLRISNPVIEIQRRPDYLIEYAEEPLLPLLEACAPLMKIIRDLSLYIRIVLQETPDVPPDGLTFDESAAIRLYTIEWPRSNLSLYSMLNLTLKKCDRQALRPYFKYLKLLLTALTKLPCAPLQTVWRGVNKDLSEEFPRGTPVIWWAFSSCTTSLTVLNNNMYLSDAGERTLFSVEALNGRIVRAHSHFDFEDEILLLPGTYMEVQSQLSPAPGLHIVHLKQIKPIETLLKLPFEGALLYPLEKKKVPWYKKKRTIGELSILIGLCIAGIIVGAILGTRKSPPPLICRTRSTGIKADLFWSFDCNDAREDLKGLYNGTSENGANYSSSDFSSHGSALNLNRRLSQSIRLPQSLNLSVNTSFTVSAWILSTGYNVATILSDCNSLNSVCIELYVYSVAIYAKTYNWNNISNSQLVWFNAWEMNYQSCWIHLAYTFNNQTNMLSMYFNGVRLTSQSFSPSSMATMSTNKSLISYIGSSSISDHRNPFDGLIDQLSILYYAKNDSEILNEATLLSQYNFQTDDINSDSGPNNLQGYSKNVNRSLSNNQSNLLFNSTDSYFQSSGFTLLMSKLYEFTFAFWLRPIIIQSNESNNAIAILQLASKVQLISSESYVCFLSILIANSTTDKPYFQFNYGQLNMYTSLDRYVVKNNTWIHIGATYSRGYQLTFYIDGKPYGYINDTRFSLLLYNPRLALTIGGNYFDDMATIRPTNYESRKCFAENPQFNYTQMYGEIDDLKIFARALRSSDFAILGSTKNKTI